MALEHLIVDGLINDPSFSQAVIAEGRRTVYISGQVALDAEGGIVGRGDFAAQAKKAYENLAIALGAAGATIGDVAKTNVYIVNYDPSVRRDLNTARRAVFSEGSAPASTLIGVQALALPDLMIEVEAIAVLD